MTKEVSLKAVANNTEQKFTIIQVNGLAQVFRLIRNSNMMDTRKETTAPANIVNSLPFKVDYWVGKNEAALNSLQTTTRKDVAAIYEKHTTQKEVKGSKYVVFKGKDENDLLIQQGPNFYREIEVDGKPDYEHVGFSPVWEEVKEPAVEAVEAGEGIEAVAAKPPVIEKHPYEILFLSEQDKEDFMTEMAALEVDEKYPLTLYKLDAKYLDGVRIAWPDPNNPERQMEEFRKLLYEYAITNAE